MQSRDRGGERRGEQHGHPLGLALVPGAELLKPAANELLQRWPSSKRVNSSRAPNDDLTLIDRISF
jgi:hypothetical protein